MLKASFRRAFVFSCLFLLPATNLCAGDDLSPAPQTRAQKAGYALGYRLAAGIRSDDLEVNMESTMQGFQDAANGKQPVLLDLNEMAGVIRQLRNEAAQKARGEVPEETTQENQELREEKARKVGYTMAYRFAAGKRVDELDVDFASTTQGFQDAMDGKQPVVDGKEMASLLQDLEMELREKDSSTVREMIVKNYEESEKFLKENAEKEGIRTTESGLQYRVLKEGDGPRPKVEDIVTVHYKGTFIDGTEFDNSYARGEPANFQTDGVIKGWTEALQMMKVGSKWKVFLPPELAYGVRGLGERIPPNKVLVFEMELVSIEPPED